MLRSPNPRHSKIRDAQCTSQGRTPGAIPDIASLEAGRSVYLKGVEPRRDQTAGHPGPPDWRHRSSSSRASLLRSTACEQSPFYDLKPFHSLESFAEESQPQLLQPFSTGGLVGTCDLHRADAGEVARGAPYGIRCESVDLASLRKPLRVAAASRDHEVVKLVLRSSR